MDSNIVREGVVVTWEVNSPVNAEGTGSCGAECFALMSHAFGKNDHWEVSWEGIDDAFDPLQRHVRVVRRWAEGSSGVKDLQSVYASLDLHFK